jgi:hypothetical protein
MGSDCGTSPWLAMTFLESSPIVCWSDGREYYAQINMSLHWSGSVANGLEGIHSAASNRLEVALPQAQFEPCESGKVAE